MKVGLLASPKQGSWHVCLATAAETFCCGRFPRVTKEEEEKLEEQINLFFPAGDGRPGRRRKCYPKDSL